MNTIRTITALALLVGGIVNAAEPIEYDRDVWFAVYTIRGGPEPKAIPHHKWHREEVDPVLCWDEHPLWKWQLYRLRGAPPFRRTEKCWNGTWVPAELDTPDRWARRASQGNSGLTNYEIYVEPQLAMKGKR